MTAMNEPEATSLFAVTANDADATDPGAPRKAVLRVAREQESAAEPGSAFVPSLPAEPLAELAPPASSPGAAEPQPTAAEFLKSMQRMEQTLVEIRNRVERTEREGQYKEVSFATYLGALAQVFGFCFLLWGLSDLYFQTDKTVLLTKLGFAGVAQMAALTAFVFARRDSRS